MKKLLMMMVAAELLLTACSGRKPAGTGPSPQDAGLATDKNVETEITAAEEDEAELENEYEPRVTTRLMPEELDAAELNEIRQSISKAIAKAELSEDFLVCQSGDDETENIDPDAWLLLERVASIGYMYDGPHYYAHLWASEDSVETLLRQFLLKKSTQAAAVDTATFANRVFDEVYDWLGGGSQLEMNIGAWYMSQMETYRTIRVYRDVQQLTAPADTTLRHLYFTDFTYWEQRPSDIQTVEHGGYSAFPMELAGYRWDVMRLRYAMLQEEMALMRSGSLPAWDMAAHPIRWEGAKDGYDRTHTQLLRPWYDCRMAWADAHADHPFAQALRLMTHKTVYTYSTTVRFGMEPI